MYTAEKEKFLTKLGRDIEIDPYDPNPYIKPRPGKYGWKDETKGTEGLSTVEAEEAMRVKVDAEIAAKGQTMTDSEREENLNIIRRLRQNDVRMLRKSGDLLGSAEAASDANAREAADPWFGLNERLGDAVKYDTEDAAALKELIAKVGGPPPQLVKYADNARGYVLRTEVIGMTISNERLEKMIDRKSALEEETSREEARRESVRKQMSQLDNPRKEESDMAEIAEIARQREENYMRGMFDMEARTSAYAEATRPRKKRARSGGTPTLWRSLSAGPRP